MKIATFSLMIVAMGQLACPCLASTVDELRPSIIDFSLTLSEARQKLTPFCSKLEEREIIPSEFPGTRDRHVQLDCEGFIFADSPRLAEFSFKDGTLMLVWILTTSDDEKHLEESLTKAYGPPSHKTDTFTGFLGYGTALRKDWPEILYFSPSVRDKFKAAFDAGRIE